MRFMNRPIHLFRGTSLLSKILLTILVCLVVYICILKNEQHYYINTVGNIMRVEANFDGSKITEFDELSNIDNTGFDKRIKNAKRNFLLNTKTNTQLPGRSSTVKVMTTTGGEATTQEPSRFYKVKGMQTAGRKFNVNKTKHARVDNFVVNQPNLLSKIKPPMIIESEFDVMYTSTVNKKWNFGGSMDYYKKEVTESPIPEGMNECYDWEYDAADYTLVYKPTKHLQKGVCSYPTNETVKKIVTPNKDIIWKGCTKFTVPCSQGRYFDHEKNMRRNVPPCCRAKLLEMLQHFDEAVSKRNVTYTLIAGALMGWYRNQKLVPYDGDLDLIVDGNIYNTGVWHDIFDELNKTYGHTYKRLEDYKVKLYYSKHNNLAIDIWPYYNIKLRTRYGELSPGELVTFIFHASYTAIRQASFFPPKRTTIDGVACNVPRDTVDYLNKNYGPTPKYWIPEMTCREVDAGNCIV